MIKIIFEYGNRFVPDRVEESLVTSIDAGGNICLNLASSSQYCGICQYQIKKIGIFDYLSLFKFRKKCNQILSVAILPNIELIEDRLAIDNSSVLVESDLFSSVKSGDDASELYGIRPYEQGDKMNRIHWKLSLKQDELLIKQFGLPINCAVMIMADFYHGENVITLPLIDAVIDTLLSLSLSLVYQEQIHYMLWYDKSRDLCERFRVEKEEECYEAASLLFRSDLLGSSHDLLTYHEAQYSKEQYTNIFYITSNISEDLIVRLNNQRKSAITHLLYISDQETVQNEWIDYGKELGIKMQVLRPAHIFEDFMRE